MRTSQTAYVVVGDERLVAHYTVYGKHVPAQLYGDYPHPEEWPEVELDGLYASDGVTDLSGLLEFGPLLDTVQEQVEQYVAERELEGPDPDEAYERAKEQERLQKEGV